MVFDYIERLKEKCQGQTMSPADEEIATLAHKIYSSLKGGTTKKYVRSNAISLIRSIKPEISDHELVMSGQAIEAIVLATLCEFLSSGEIISIKEEGGSQDDSTK